MGEKIPEYGFEAKPTDFDFALGLLPFGPHQPGTIHKFVYYAGQQFGYLWAFSYHPLKQDQS